MWNYAGAKFPHHGEKSGFFSSGKKEIAEIQKPPHTPFCRLPQYKGLVWLWIYSIPSFAGKFVLKVLLSTRKLLDLLSRKGGWNSQDTRCRFEREPDQNKLASVVSNATRVPGTLTPGSFKRTTTWSAGVFTPALQIIRRNPPYIESVRDNGCGIRHWKRRRESIHSLDSGRWFANPCDFS